MIAFRKLLHIVVGLLTYFPGFLDWRQRRHGAGGTTSARYCYAIWMRHVIKLRENNLNTHPNIIAELGPGGSVGIGLTALLLGTEKYLAFDVVNFENIKSNLVILEDLIQMLDNRESIPDKKEFPNVQPYLDDFQFPSNIYSEEHMKHALSIKRIEKIRQSVLNPRSPNSMITYKAPWFNADVCLPSSVDLIYSQAVLEHVDDLDETYRTMKTWLKHGGVMSHSIDFKSHGYAHTWDGHWAISNLRWRIMRGKRPYMINRQPLSTHLRLIKKNGFSIINLKKIEHESTVLLENLVAHDTDFTSEDRRTSGVYLQAVTK